MKTLICTLAALALFTGTTYSQTATPAAEPTNAAEAAAKKAEADR